MICIKFGKNEQNNIEVHDQKKEQVLPPALFCLLEEYYVYVETLMFESNHQNAFSIK